jgi:hypothetical protein
MNTVPAFPLVATPEGDRGPRDAVEDMDGETSNAIGSVKRALTDARTANLTREVIALEAALSLLEKVWFREERSECSRCEGSGVIPCGQFGSTVQRPGTYDFPTNEPCDDCNGTGKVQDEPTSSGPTVPVQIVIDGKTFVEQMTVDMSGLAAAIVERALKFTDANDRGDEASRLLEQFDDDLEGPEAAGLAQAGDAADEDYNNEKARLFELCRLLAAARTAEQSTGSAS